MSNRAPLAARIRVLALIASLTTILAVGAAAAPISLALFVDTDVTAGSFGTDTLDPPTALAATGGLSASLTWTPTVDAYASGYRVFRSPTSGSGFLLVSSVTPRTAASTTDAPPSSGTWYYALRSYFQGWTSLQTAEVSALIVGGPVSSGFRACAASLAEPAWGDGNGYELNTANACADGGGVASDVSTGTAGRSTSCTNTANDAHRFLTFGLGLPPAVLAVQGIQVRADLGMNNNGGSSLVCAQLSWDGGTTWTTTRSAALGGAAESTYLLGGAADTWGRAWTAAELSDATFRVRLIGATGQPNKDYLLDHVAVAVTYVP